MKKITHSEMINNINCFYPVNHAFKPKALQSRVVINGSEVLHLVICVEWDSKEMGIGYVKELPFGTRAQNGLESFYFTQRLIDADRQNYGVGQDDDVLLNDHHLIECAAEYCFSALSSHQPLDVLKKHIEKKLIPDLKV